MFIGTLVDCSAIALGTTIGCLAGKYFSQQLRKTCIDALALVVIVIGLEMCFAHPQPMVLLGSVTLGALVGEIFNLEGRCQKVEYWFTKRFAAGDASFFPAFVQASLIFLTGTMAILGPLQEGLSGDATLLYTKAVLDGVTAIVLASTMGIGVAFSVLSVQLFQGSVALMGAGLGHFFSELMVHNISAVGGVLLIGISLNLLNLTQLRLMNLLPALLFGALFSFL